MKLISVACLIISLNGYVVSAIYQDKHVNDQETVVFTEILPHLPRSQNGLRIPTERSKNRRSYEDTAYADAAASYIPSSTPAPYKPSNPTVAALYPNLPKSAMPLLLNCAPIITGHLKEYEPSYRVVKTNDNDALSANSPLTDEGDVLSLNSPVSVLTLERRRQKRNDELKGITYYRVSEDYPENNPGNHHLVSADYPHPNMIRITPSNNRYL